MSEVITTKLIVETASGSLIKAPATIEFQDGRIWFLKSPFALKDEIRTMAGSRWHGYDEENPQKIWSVADCFRNRFQLGYLMGEDVYEWFDRDLIRHEYTRPLMDHQCALSDSGLTYHYQIFAAEMGCVDGNAEIQVDRQHSFRMPLRDLYHKFHGGATYRNKRWSPDVPTFVKALKGDYLGHHLLKNVLHQGERHVVSVRLTNGESIRVTPDHEFYTPDLALVPAERLQRGDHILVSGQMRGVTPHDALQLSSGDYVEKYCPHHPRNRHGMVREHVLVMEEHLGRHLRKDEVVHHINARRNDNRLENLQLMLRGEHKKLHTGETAAARWRCNKVAVGEIDVVQEAGIIDVYDLVMADPYRNFVANGFVVKNCGKTLSAQEVIERSNQNHWFWVGPKSSLTNIRREFGKWGFTGRFIDHQKTIDTPSLTVEAMTYERLVRVMDEWVPGDPVPGGVIFDESSRLKTWTSQRSRAAAKLANLIRDIHQFEGYVILMSGTPAPKRPTDHWSQCEIAWPGFLREGSPKALEQRLAFMVKQEFDSGTFWKTIGWKDDQRKCDVCGELEDHPCHMIDNFIDEADEEFHKFEPSKNEVAYLHERLKGLAVIKHKKDCLSLPDKRYRKVLCQPSASVLRVAKALAESAPNAVTGMTLLRELSDGFQYREVEDGTTKCNHCVDACGEVEEWFDPQDERRIFQAVDMLDEELVTRLRRRAAPCPKCHGSGEIQKYKRVTREVPCPKERALRDLLEENEETGRIVIFAGFTGSVDRVVGICRREGWCVVRCDGRGFHVTDRDGSTVTDVEALDYWADLAGNPRVAFVAHPESGGMSLTLTEARMAVYWSNSWKPEYRVQSEDRIHRKGMDENLGCTIVDLIHLPTDERVLEIIRENRKLELLTMGEITQDVNWEDADRSEAVEVVEVA